MKTIFFSILALVFFARGVQANDSFHIGKWNLRKEYCGAMGGSPQKLYDSLQITFHEDGRYERNGSFDGCNFQSEGNYLIENTREFFLIEKSASDCRGARETQDSLIQVRPGGYGLFITNIGSPGCKDYIYMQEFGYRY